MTLNLRALSSFLAILTAKQVLTLARQALYHLSYSASPKLSFLSNLCCQARRCSQLFVSVCSRSIESINHESNILGKKLPLY
jgi:hypothetical protein